MNMNNIGPVGSISRSDRISGVRNTDTSFFSLLEAWKPADGWTESNGEIVYNEGRKWYIQPYCDISTREIKGEVYEHKS